MFFARSINLPKCWERNGQALKHCAQEDNIFWALRRDLRTHSLRVGFYITLNMQFDPPTLLHDILKLGKRRFYPILQEHINLLWRTADETGWIEQLVELICDGIEVRIFSDSVNKIILEAEVLHSKACFVREYLSMAYEDD